MTQIVVDGGGSWWSASAGLLRSGVHETDNADLIEEARTSGLSWIEVIESEATVVEPVPVPTAPLEPSVPAEETTTQSKDVNPPVEVAPGVTQVVDANPGGHVPNTAGPLTTADLHPQPEQFSCGACDFHARSHAGLMSHRRNKHPEVDPMTGAPKEPTESVQEKDTQPSQSVEGSGPSVGA